MKSFSLAAKAIPTNGSTERNNSTETMRSLRNLECDDGGGSGDTTTSTSDYFLLASSRTNHAFVQSTSTLKSRITNNYETMEPGFEKGTTNTVKRITSANAHDADTADFYSYNHDALVYDPDGGGEGNAPKPTYYSAKSVHDTSILSATALAATVNNYDRLAVPPPQPPPPLPIVMVPTSATLLAKDVQKTQPPSVFAFPLNQYYEMKPSKTSSEMTTTTLVKCKQEDEDHDVDDDAENVLKTIKEIHTHHHHYHHSNGIGSSSKEAASIGDSCCCVSCRSCLSCASVCCSVLSCFTGCCFRPCCSMASTCLGLITLGAFLTIVILLAFFGVLRIPRQVTQTICNMSNAFDHQQPYQNITDFNTITLLPHFNETTNSTKFNSMLMPTTTTATTTTTTTFSSTRTTTTTTTVKTTLANSIQSLPLSARSLRIRMAKNKARRAHVRKMRSETFVPLKYEVVFAPQSNNRKQLLSEEAKAKAKATVAGVDADAERRSSNLEMNVDMSVHLYCNFSTNALLFKTRAFKRLHLNLQALLDASPIGIKNWNYVATLHTLHVQLTRNCTRDHSYVLKLSVSYPNYNSRYASMISNSGSGNNKPLGSSQTYYMASFNDRANVPFPILIENGANQYAQPQRSKHQQANADQQPTTRVFSRRSLFNISMIKPDNLDISLVFNTEMYQKTKVSGFDYFYYTPAYNMPIEMFGFIFGDLKCNERSELDKFKMRMHFCATNPKEKFGDTLDVVANYVRSLFEFYTSYTKLSYYLRKIDVIILPLQSYVEVANSDVHMSQLGLVYLPITFISGLNSVDQLTKVENEMRIVNALSRQLSRHWLARFLATSNGSDGDDDDDDADPSLGQCDKNVFSEDFLGKDVTLDSISLLRSNVHLLATTNGAAKQTANFNQSHHQTQQLPDKTLTSYLEFNERCFLNIGLINWIAYLAFRVVYPDLFDLVYLEWSKIKDLDDEMSLFLYNKNLNSNNMHHGMVGEFPLLSEKTTFSNAKNEIKSLNSMRALYLLFGNERFQNAIVDWLDVNKRNTPHLNYDESAKSSLASVDELQQEVNTKTRRHNKTVALLHVLEQYVTQYNLIPIENIRLRSVLRSWMLADNNIHVNFVRNNNNKEASISIDNFDHELSNKSIYQIINAYYPLNYVSGFVKTTFKSSTNEQKLPVDLTTKNPQSDVKWMIRGQHTVNDELVRSLPGADKWILANYMQMLPNLRINYDRDNWRLIIEQFIYDFKRFDVIERVQLIDDMFYMVENNKLPISYALDLIEYLRNEASYLPWKFVIKHLKKLISDIEDDSNTYLMLREHLIELIKPTYHRLKWGESSLDTIDEKLIRILVVDLLCSIDYEDCVENSVKQLTDSIKINVYNIPQYLSKSVYCTAIRYTGINEWFFLWRYFLQQADSFNNNKLKDSILYSLSCSSQIWILNLLLRKLVYESAISNSDIPTAFEYISQNSVGKYIVWNHIVQNYQTFYNKIGNDPELFLKIVQVSTRQFKLKYEMKQVYDFIDEIGLKNFTMHNRRPKDGGVGHDDYDDDEISAKKSLPNKKVAHMNENSILDRKKQYVKDLFDWLNKKLNNI